MLGSWRSCWCALVAWKGNEEDEFCGRSKLVGVEVQREKEIFTAAQGFIHATKCVLWMRTPERGPASRQLRV